MIGGAKNLNKQRSHGTKTAPQRRCFGAFRDAARTKWAFYANPAGFFIRLHQSCERMMEMLLKNRGQRRPRPPGHLTGPRERPNLSPKCPKPL